MKDTKIISCKASTSISSILSSATATARTLIESKFPKGFFKHVHISDGLNEIQTEKDDFNRMSKPTLIITPRYSTENGYMDLIPRWQYTHQFMYTNKRKNYNGVLFDNINNIFMYSIPDRIKLVFDFKIKLPSVQYAYNVMHVVKQSFEVGGYTFLNDVRLYTEIPKLYTHIIAEELGLDKDNVDDFNKLEGYMLQNSYKGLVDKVNLASGNRQFMYNYSVNVLMNFPDEPQFERNTNGHVIDNAVVNFSAVFDFWINSNYILEIKSERKLDDYPEIDVFEDSNMKYEYLIPTHFIKEHLSENMHMILNKPFVPDINEEVDELGFGVILNKELKNVIKVIRDKGLDLEKILEVKVLIDNRELDKNLYDVDWKNYNLKTHKPLSNVTYVFLLYGDMKKIHTINNLILENQLDKIDSLGYDKV